jgi:hypothetical protein
MKWEIESSNVFSAIYGMDPYANWLLTRAWTEFSRLGEPADPIEGSDDTLIPFVVELLSIEARDIMEISKLHQDDKRALPILIPELNSLFMIGSHIFAFATRKFFRDLATLDELRYSEFRSVAKRIKLSLPLKPHQQQERKAVGSGDKLNPPEDVSVEFQDDPLVVIGIIDDGIAFANDRFRAKDCETRIAYFWRQDGDYLKQSVPYGREISAHGINLLLNKYSRGGIVDEDQIYAEFGTMKFSDIREQDHKPVAQRYAHGTHVLDLAAGYPMAEAPRDRPIIAVQLPVATTADTSGTTLDVYVKHAINYIYDRAQQLRKHGGPPPIVINFSYGVTAGPHDGTSVLEHAIDNFVKTIEKSDARPFSLTFILPAGNAQLSRAHARVCWHGDDEVPYKMLHWRVQPNGMTTSKLQMWLPRRDDPTGSRVLISIETPGGLQSGQLEEVHGREVVLYDDHGRTIAVASYTLEVDPTDPSGHRTRGLFLIALRPTEHLREFTVVDPDAPAGVWAVRVWRGPAYKGEDIEAWIQRDDTPFGYPIRGRQSYFDESDYLRFDEISGRPVEVDPSPPYRPSHVKRLSLINAIATSCEPVVVGGVFRKELVPAEYSAGGPTWTYCGGNGQRMGPDVAAVSDDSRIHRGVLGAGSRSGSAFALSGTSVAAPQIAREAAKLFAKGAKKVGRKQIAEDAIKEEKKHKKKWPPRDPLREGQGRIIRPSSRLKRVDDD